MFRFHKTINFKSDEVGMSNSRKEHDIICVVRSVNLSPNQSRFEM